MLTLAVLKPTALATPPPDNENMWAVIICADMFLQRDSSYLYEVLTHHYHFTEILYLHPNLIPRVNVNKPIIRWAIRDWLGARSNEDDLVFIFIISHGFGAYGYNETASILVGGRYELNSDEGDEYAETELFYGGVDPFTGHWTLLSNVDFDGDGIIEDDVYAGVDECVQILSDYDNGTYEFYWDDEAKEDLDTLSYGQLIFFFQGCQILNQSGHCFSGGFVRDLSAPNRIIITSSNETTPSYGYWIDDPDAPPECKCSGNFSRPFISALDPWNAASQADIDGNGLVSVGEAFRYAWEHDTAVEGRWFFDFFRQETPWLDDDGDGIANYLDGAFANETFFARALPVQEHRYVVMGGVTTTSGQRGIDAPWFEDVRPRPFHTRDPYLTPLLMGLDITFSEPDNVTGVVYLTVPAESYVGLDHIWWDSEMYYVRHRLIMESDGYGWLFTGEGTGDVDYYTFSNDTGTYWNAPGDPYEFNGQLAIPTFGHAHNVLPSPGPDGVAGTGDDGFGDGTLDPPGSSILYLPTTLDVDHYSGGTWVDWYEAPWPQVWTTGTAYNIVTEPNSYIDGVSSAVVGEPWEFLAGIDHPEYNPVPWNHDKCNAYVTYVCAWSVLNVYTYLGDLDIQFKVEERLVREDCVIADIDGNEIVDIVDIAICASTYEKQDEDFLFPEADAGYDARADVADPRGYIDIVDMARIASYYDWQLTPNCILK